MKKFSNKKSLLVSMSVLVSLILYTLYFIPDTTRAAAPTNGLVGYWNFDEGSGTVANDTSGNNNNGTINGATWTAGKVGNGALSLNGVNQYITINNSPSLNPIVISISAWIKTDSAGTYKQILTKDANEGGRVWQFRISNTNKIQFIPFNSSTNGNYAGSITVTDGLWHHVVGTWDGVTINVYVDGVKDGNGTAFSGSLRTGQGNRVIVGADDIPPAPQDFFNGSIDEVRVYNRALSATEVSDI